MQELNLNELEEVNGGILGAVLVYLYSKSGVDSLVSNHETVTGTSYWGQKV